jgi:hypothetical protein
MLRSNSFKIMAFALAAAASMSAASAYAAEIHGTVSEGGKPLPQGVALKLDCGGTTASASTDQFGGYSLKLAASGQCKVSIDYKGGSASLPVAVFEKPSRYDLEVKQDAGKLTLTRK